MAVLDGLRAAAETKQAPTLCARILAGLNLVADNGRVRHQDEPLTLVRGAGTVGRPEQLVAQRRWIELTAGCQVKAAALPARPALPSEWRRMIN